MPTKKFNQSLQFIVELLDSLDIKYVIYGSALLWLNGLDVPIEPKDIDIIIDRNDLAKLQFYLAEQSISTTIKTRGLIEYLQINHHGYLAFGVVTNAILSKQGIVFPKAGIFLTKMKLSVPKTYAYQGMTISGLDLQNYLQALKFRVEMLQSASVETWQYLIKHYGNYVSQLSNSNYRNPVTTLYLLKVKVPDIIYFYIQKIGITARKKTYAS